jgi:hypothetical protein
MKWRAAVERGYLDIKVAYTIHIEYRWRVTTSLVPKVDFPEENF